MASIVEIVSHISKINDIEYELIEIKNDGHVYINNPEHFTVGNMYYVLIDQKYHQYKILDIKTREETCTCPQNREHSINNWILKNNDDGSMILPSIVVIFIIIMGIIMGISSILK
jgi:hypothetical protein